MSSGKLITENIHAQPIKIEIGTTASGKPVVTLRKYGKSLEEVNEVVEKYLATMVLLRGTEE